MNKSVNSSNLRQRNTQHQQQQQQNKANSSFTATNTQINRKEKKSSRCRTFIISLFLLIPIILLPIIPFISLNKPINAQYIKLPKKIEFNDPNLLVNDRLEHAKYIGKSKFRGAEAIEFVNDTMYASLLNGQVAIIDADGNPHKVVQAGELSSTECDNYGLHSTSNFECGRPLGLRYHPPHFLYFADAYHGIFKVDLRTNEKIKVIGSDDKRFKENPMKFTNDVDVDDEGNVYFTDSSTSRRVNDAIELHVEGKSDGKLYKFNEKTQTLVLLMDNLYFPNGIQLTPEKDAIIIAETNMPRLLKYYIKGSVQGHHEVFTVLPGFPDNIRLSEHKTLLVSFAIVRKHMPTILDLLGEYPTIRSYIGSILDLRGLLFKLPKYGLVVEYDFNGDIVRSWHDRTGKVIESVATAKMHNNKLYLGSYHVDYIGVVDY